MAINTSPISNNVKSKASRPVLWLLALLAIAMIGLSGILLLATYLNQPDNDIVLPASFEIEPGTSVKEVTKNLADANIIRSEHLLYFILTLFHDPKDIKASTYVFEEPMTTREVAYKLVTGDFGNDLLSFTHFEGERATHIAAAASELLDSFDSEKFIELAVPLEGKLYPETYRIPKDFTAEELVDLMLKTYTKETSEISERITSHPLGENGVLTLASIIEREANTIESMKMVSGILQGRMEIGMPLQADASIEYVLDKPLKELTPEDLKVDSPYNTYTNRGLPPTPIGNPGIDAILAVLEPTRSDYVYYITDEEGNFHYAKDFDEHRINVAKYLR